MNEPATEEPAVAPEREPWYKTVLARMLMLALFAVLFSVLLGYVVRYIAPF